ncbi:Rrf2 family transcriptional regulator [Thiobacillus denitrificans]|uniref:Rrf2 family transcriptional regulator n=1 Tax=Thiobacillus denitrificans TaxID=36861 RepID=UPI00037C5BD5|nr:Rrf2 family transcriptional regulator [Thiobacillus denitrificans]
MQLTRFTDFSLRVLIYLGAHPDGRVTVAEIASEHGISRHHLTRVVHQLGVKGYIETVRGKGGGFRLARRPEQIRIGDVVRDMESGFELAECFRPGDTACRLLPGCALKPVLLDAGRAFLASLDAYTLADLLPAFAIPIWAANAKLGEAPAVAGKTPHG